MNRRAFLIAAGLGSVAAALGRGDLLAAAESGPGGEPFSWDILKARAKALAAAPFQNQGQAMPKALANLNYDQYRNIEFRSDRAIWNGTEQPYRLELFHNGYIYRDPVGIYLVESGRATPLRYDKAMFDFGPAELRVPLPDEAGFSGLRVHAPVNEPNVFEEFLVYQGASYFRGKAKGQTYGLSARGLAINTAQPEGEEFPSFSVFWAQTPAPGDQFVTIYALLDSQSTTGAYRFTVGRGVDVVMEVECEIHPRRVLTHAGIAPFSSMFFFGPADPSYHDDFRPRVHDSDGLLIQTSEGEWIWRPLVTANHILYSMFSDEAPSGFGLMQRQRDFEHYQDTNAGYEKRPSSWVQPLSDWGPGSVDLIELPTATEYADNIVAFWRPRQPLEPGHGYEFRYRLSWCWHVPIQRRVAEVVLTRGGAGIPANSRYFLIDFAGGDLHAQADEEHWDYEVTASAGFIRAYTVAANDHTNGKRIGIEYHPEGHKEADLSFQIRKFGEAVTEKWVYRWAP
jgi:glucans biosynthesis protein